MMTEHFNISQMFYSRILKIVRKKKFDPSKNKMMF